MSVIFQDADEGLLARPLLPIIKRYINNQLKSLLKEEALLSALDYNKLSVRTQRSLEFKSLTNRLEMINIHYRDLMLLMMNFLIPSPNQTLTLQLRRNKEMR